MIKKDISSALDWCYYITIFVFIAIIILGCLGFVEMK